MSLELFVSGYSGTVAEATRAMLLDNGATAGTNQDLWRQFLTALGFTGGTVNDDLRAFLIDYLAVSDTGQTIDDLWGQIDAPYTPLP